MNLHIPAGTRWIVKTGGRKHYFPSKEEAHRFISSSIPARSRYTLTPRKIPKVLAPWPWERQNPRRRARRNPGQVYGSKALGAAMHNWHSSQGDPVYGVGSMFYAGHGADEEQVERALSNLERVLRAHRRERGPYTELRGIISALKYALRR